MTYELHMSGVITGSLNSFCLACDVFLKSPHEATDHIRTSEHQKKADAVQFSHKFPNEYIKQFKWGYYCEFCNVLMPIASKVNVHITEVEHKHKKGLLLLKPLGLDVVAFNNVLIEENAWHGLTEGVCSLCNVEFEDENDHKANADHSLNLVLKPIQFGADNAIFRYLDNSAVQCLTCNKLLAPGRMNKHFVDTEHLELYAKCRIETNGVCRGPEAKENCQEKANHMTSVENDDEMKKPKIDEVNKKINREDKNQNKTSPTEDKSKILESIVKYQTKGININLETETAFCKKCSEVVTFDFNEIENHISNHSSTTVADSDLLYPSHLDQHLNRVDINDKTTQYSDDQHNEVKDTLKDLRENVQSDSSNEENYDTISTHSVDEWDNPPTENLEKDVLEEEASNFAKANKITYNMNYKESFCRVCEVHLPASFKSLKEHVEGTNHRRLVTSSKPSTTQPKTPGKLSKQETIVFLESVIHIKSFFHNASMINEKYCILQNSFFLISKNGSRMRCFVCDINLPPYLDVEDHVDSLQHLDKWKKVPVITSTKNEFIREVRPGLYHCGFCHLVVSGWTDMKCHLECTEHREHKNRWELQQRLHMPSVQQHIRQERMMQGMAMMRLFHMFG